MSTYNATLAARSTGQHYMSLREAVEDGYASYQTLRNWIKQGKLPAVRVGNRYRVLRTDLEAVLHPDAPTRSTDASVIAWAERQALTAPALTSEQIELAVETFWSALDSSTRTSRTEAA